MQIYYINLVRRTDRRAFMDEQFAALGLKATRIEAATPDDVSPAELAAYCHPSRPFWLSVKEYACSLSHFRAMSALLEAGQSHAVIFEDDATLSRQLPQFLAALDAEPRSFDLLRIETVERRLRLRPVGAPVAGIEIARFIGYEGGAAGYIVSRDGAKRILGDARARQRPIDQALFDSHAPLGRRLTVLQINPALCIQSREPASGVAELVSDLGTGDHRPAAEAPYRRRHRLHRLGRAVHRDIVVGLQKAWFVHARGGRLLRIPFAP